MISEFGVIIYEDFSKKSFAHQSIIPVYAMLGSFYLTYSVYGSLSPLSWLYLCGGIALNCVTIQQFITNWFKFSSTVMEIRLLNDLSTISLLLK